MRARVALGVILALAAAAPAAARQATLRYTCDLHGGAAEMQMVVEYVAAFDPLFNYQGNITGLFPAGVTIYTAGTVQSPTAAYSFRGENDFADFTDHITGARFRVQWMLDGPRNGVWMRVNPFGGTTVYFCALQDAR